MSDLATMRSELAMWPIPQRERWGELANHFQDQGIPWPDHELQAFERVKAGDEPPAAHPEPEVAKPKKAKLTQQRAWK